ncbi:MAG: hypothetical protein COV67_11645 [Nitrospinae bacterium CG11_big_fil_rev_8_21_14_0_20_56_8]|nr:MAG: hypothetical protein COV67_11645 [Nitrospinae bacterium CG11_big_fil_rev_8_21_14_0_20_56_8]
MIKSFTLAILGAWMVMFSLIPVTVEAADTKAYTDILKKIDSLVCSQPNKITEFYSSKLVIMTDDKRALLENRIQDYQQMMSDFKNLKCSNTRSVLAGESGEKVGYILVDELISVTSESTDTDIRQHSVCNYVFTKDGAKWKIALEQCSSLPDYTIRPGEDALYYFHNPVY